MPPERRPKRLHDVSHLFLSKNKGRTGREERTAKAVIWLAVCDRSLNRAHLAAGTGSAFARQGLSVTILELGDELPNVGYYFALEPSEYLSLTLGDSSVITGVSGSSIRYAIALELEGLSAIEESSPSPASPHVVVAAFTWSAGTTRKELLGDLSVRSGCLLDRSEPRSMLPDGMVVFRSRSMAGRDRELLDAFTKVNPDGVVFDARTPGFKGRTLGAGSKIVLPPGLRGSWVRRMPPSEQFFTDLASSFLQIVSLRRKRAAGDSMG